MKSFSKLNEEVINLERFELTETQFREYQDLIYEVLQKGLYVHKVEAIVGLGLFIKALSDDEKEGRDFSILNKVNTNITLLRWLVTKLFKVNAFYELKAKIRENKFALFTPDGRFYSQVRNILVNTERQGILNEEFAARRLKFAIKKILNVDVDPKVTTPMSREDMINGVDITFTLNDKQYTCQVKPLIKSILKNDGQITSITSSGRIKPYNTNYLIFVDMAEQESIIVRNDEKNKKLMSINGTVVDVPTSSIVEY